MRVNPINMNEQKLIDILQIQSATYNQFRIFFRIIREIAAIPNCQYYVMDGNIYVTKGQKESYSCMVAHMDTVHDIAEGLVAVQVGRNITGINPITMRQSGIGGDDKVGVFIALETLRLFDNIKIAFFRDEETGCQGSYLADLGFFDDCNFVLQCDRQGHRDFVVEAGGIALSSIVFQEAVSPLLRAYQYKAAKGLMTDVMALKEIGVACSVANLSCGYFNPHRDDEFVNLDCVSRCLRLVVSIIQELGDIHFPHFIEAPAFRHRESFSSVRGPLLYCRDCWSAPASNNGYCSGCNEYYRQLMQ